MLVSCRPASFAAVSAYRAAVIADGAVGYWRLGEASGTVAVDEIGAAHNGIYEGSPTLGATGLITGDLNTAATFAGANDVAITVSTTILLASDFSLECWIKTNNAGLNTLVFGTYSGTSNSGHGIGIYLTNVFVAFDGVGAFIVSTPSIADNAKHHLCCTFTGVSPNVTGRVYFDGALVGTSASRSITAGGVLTIASYAGAGGGFSGTMDECAIYNSVLTPTQILNHYNLGV